MPRPLTAAAPHAPPPLSPGSPGARYKWYVCFVLMLALAFSYMDKTILGLLVSPIEHDLGISDTAMGLLQETAFATFYVVCIFPLARIADRGNRRNLILAGVLVWCTATACCSVAQDIYQLFAARVMVAIGEAVLMPSAVSILSDYFTPARRGFALNLYTIGLYLGAASAFGGGGFLMHHLPAEGVLLPILGRMHAWRIVFLAIGLLGLVLVPLLLLVREPARLGNDGRQAEAPMSMRQVMTEFGKRRAAILCCVFGYAMITVGGTALTAWAPTLFVRMHGWSVGSSGMRLGIMTITLGPLGAICGSYLADAFARRGRRDAKILVGMVSASGLLAGSLLLTQAPLAVALCGMALMNFLLGFNFGMLQAALSELVPNRMRAMSSALYVITANLLSALFGPLLVGALNDHLFHDPMRLADSLRIVLPAAFCLGILILWRGLRPHREAVAQIAVP